MRCLPAILALVFAMGLLSLTATAQEEPGLVVEALDTMLPGAAHSELHFDYGSGITWTTNGIYIKYGKIVLMADRGSLNNNTLDVVMDGHVRIETGDALWVGEHASYNLKTRQMHAEEFRTGRIAMLAAGEGLAGDLNSNLFTGTNVYVTTDDISDPAVRVVARRIKIIPNQSIEMWNATLWAEGVPVFYFPYYYRHLGPHANNFNFLPGYRSTYGAYSLNNYTWYWNDEVDGKLHADYRSKRGVGLGPDVNLHLGRWGDATIRYYYTHDDRPLTGTNALIAPVLGVPISKDRQRFDFVYQATPCTNLNVKSAVNYQTDPLVEHDFFENAYRDNPQPYSFVEVNPWWDNWSLDAETMPRINTLFDQVARLPDVRLTGFRQQIGNTPFYYDSQSSVGYYRKYFAENTNGIDQLQYSATRADTFHQISLPWTFFNWLNVAPNAGGRLTYYSSESGPAAVHTETSRSVFNTGIATSFKTSRLWSNATNSLLQVDGLRHVIEPTVDYVYVPTPSATPDQLPQFDSDLPSLLLLPVDFPDYNNIDSIDSQNVIRFGLRNTLQTKRDGQVENLLNWSLMLDWNLAPNGATNAPNLGVPGPQKTFDDLYSKLTFRPRTWLTVDSQLRQDINSDRLNLAYHQITFSPNERWSWGLGDWYMAAGFPDGTNATENLITSTFFYRVNDNYAARIAHYFNTQDGRLQEQDYTLYRDFRSWTGGLTFRVIDNINSPIDYTVAFSFSLKFEPQRKLGDDTVRPSYLVGGD
jgi:LPS-assembly protein